MMKRVAKKSSFQPELSRWFHPSSSAFILAPQKYFQLHLYLIFHIDIIFYCVNDIYILYLIFIFYFIFSARIEKMISSVIVCIHTCTTEIFSIISISYISYWYHILYCQWYLYLIFHIDIVFYIFSQNWGDDFIRQRLHSYLHHRDIFNYIYILYFILISYSIL